MTVLQIAHPSIDERRTAGKEAGRRTPLSSHNGWRPAADRPDPVTLLEAQNTTREPDLVPVRHGRMMAWRRTWRTRRWLGWTPSCAGTRTCRTSAFASPERDLLFDLNDFDETLPGPIEYDVKRMAASFTIAARNNGFS